MGYPSWMPNCSEVKLPSGVTGFKTYNWGFESEFGYVNDSYTGFVYSEEALLTLVMNDALTSVDLSNTSITSIGLKCFDNCTSLTSINIPEGVTSLGNACFIGCSSLTSITLPAGVTSLGDNCFRFCESLTSINIPAGVTSLGDSCFSYCTSLTLATVLPAIPPSLGGAVFDGVHTSFNIKVPDESVDLYKTESGWIAFVDRIYSLSTKP